MRDVELADNVATGDDESADYVVTSDVESADYVVTSDDETISVEERLAQDKRRKNEIKRFLKDLETSDDDSDLPEDEINLNSSKVGGIWKKETHQIQTVNLSLVPTAAEFESGPGSLKQVSNEQFKQILREKEGNGKCSGLKLIKVLVQTPATLKITTPSSNVNVVVNDNVIFRQNEDRSASLSQSPLSLSKEKSCVSEIQRNIDLKVQTQAPKESSSGEIAEPAEVPTTSGTERKVIALTFSGATSPNQTTLMSSTRTPSYPFLTRSRAKQHDGDSAAQTKTPRPTETIQKKFNVPVTGSSLAVKDQLPLSLTAQLNQTHSQTTDKNISEVSLSSFFAHSQQ